MKYIDIDRLRARIEKDLVFDNSIDTAYYRGRRDARWNILNLIDSLLDEPVDYAEELKKCKDNPLYFYDKYVKVKQEPAELDSLAKPMTHKEWAEDYWEHHKFASPNGNDKCDVIQFGHKGFIDFCIAYCVDQKPQDRLVLHDTFDYEKGRQVGQSEGVKMVLKTPESYGLYKPAEWSKEDEKMLQSIIKDFRAGKVSTIGQEQWLKSLRPQPKQEWSEVDKKVLDDAYCWLCEYAGSLIQKNHEKSSMLYEIANKLKSLRPQPKQKQNDYITPHKEFFKFIYDRLINVHKENPNVDYMRSFKERLNNLSFGEKQEWSEEDEKKITFLERLIRYNVPEGQYGWTDGHRGGFITKLEAIAILKSLRPSWKPSEEQMNELFHALIPGAEYDCDILEELYFGLKSWLDSIRERPEQK